MSVYTIKICKEKDKELLEKKDINGDDQLTPEFIQRIISSIKKSYGFRPLYLEISDERMHDLKAWLTYKENKNLIEFLENSDYEEEAIIQISENIEDITTVKDILPIKVKARLDIEINDIYCYPLQKEEKI